jgi:hypothetical protein
LLESVCKAHLSVKVDPGGQAGPGACANGVLANHKEKIAWTLGRALDAEDVAMGRAGCGATARASGNITGASATGGSAGVEGGAKVLDRANELKVSGVKVLPGSKAEQAKTSSILCLAQYDVTRLAVLQVALVKANSVDAAAEATVTALSRRPELSKQDQ